MKALRYKIYHNTKFIGITYSLDKANKYANKGYNVVSEPFRVDEPLFMYEDTI